MKFFNSILIILLTVQTSTSQNPLPFLKDALWGYMDVSGQVVLEPNFLNASFFSEDVALVRLLDESVVYIDVTGEIIFQKDIAGGTDFNEGFASVVVDEEWTVVDKNGEQMSNAFYNYPITYHNGRALIYEPNRQAFWENVYGVINTYGDTIVQPTYKHLSNFSDYLCMASVDGQLYGYIDVHGDWAIQPTLELGPLFKMNGEYDFSDKDFSEGLVGVEKEGKYGFMNTKGEVKIDYQFGSVGKFKDGLASVQIDGKYGFIDVNGDWVIKPQYDMATFFSEGLAAVAKNKPDESFSYDWGFVNNKNELIIPFGLVQSSYDFFSDLAFKNGYLPCLFEGNVFGYLNPKGEVIWKVE